MTFSFTNRLYAGFLAPIVLVLLVGILSYQTFQDQLVTSNWVRHTYQVLDKAEAIQKHLTDMETGRIRYYGTGAGQFQKLYKDAAQTIEPLITDLQLLIADNPVQVERVGRIASEVNTLLTLWQNQGDNERNLYKNKGLVTVITQEKAFTNRIRTGLDQVIHSERVLLGQREKRDQDLVKKASYKLFAGTLLTLLIVLTLIYVTVNELKSNQRAEASLQDNYQQLEHLNRVSIEKNWLLTGISVINDSLQDTTDVGSLTQSILTTMTKCLDVPASVFYCYNEQIQELQLSASVALPGQAKQTYKLGEGVVGQAALEQSLTLLTEVPTNFWTIQAASGQATPGQVVCLPLWYSKELKGVMEFASFRPFGEQELLLLKSVANNVAVAINAVDYHQKVVTLLQQVQDQKEELENQQEELQQSNDELTRQAAVLRISEQESRMRKERLRQINVELLDRNEAIEIARNELMVKAKELENNSEYKSEFLANMSHELRTPLNSVLILARLLAENKQHNLTGKQIEYANIIHKSGTDLLELINDILDLSKIEAGKVEFLYESASVARITEDMRQLFSVVADEKGLNLAIQIGDDVPAAIWTDKRWLEQVIKNLLSNAFKFTPKGGSVRLSLTMVDKPANVREGAPATSQNTLAISVTDTGIGISPEKQQIIFDAFQQVDGSISRKFGGTGLGLSISKELVRRLGGEFGLQSEVGSGSTFTVYLPLAVLPAGEQPRQISRPNSTAATVPAETVRSIRPADDRDNLSPGDKVILIVEDDPVFAGIIRDFAHEKRFKVLIALQGDEGLQYARQYVPSAIILDMGLPVVNGWDLLKILKGDEALKHIPVHVISAIDGPATLSNDIMAYTNKPVEKKELENVLTVINNYLSDTGKKVLVLSGNCLTENSLRALTDDRHARLEFDYVNTVEEAQQKISQRVYDCIVGDIGKNVEQGLVDLQLLQEAVSPKVMPFIIYLDTDLSVSAERQLHKISSIIIRNSSRSKDRLMDELVLFFHNVDKTDLPTRATLPPTDALSSGIEGKKVLVVDDDMRNVFALSTLLQANHMVVVTAGDGLEALDQLGQHPDTAIVLMDIMMPEMDGYEATRRIRTDERFIALPIIAVTAKAMTTDRQKCLEAGASDYISKPVDSTQLFSMMRVWLPQEQILNP